MYPVLALVLVAVAGFTLFVLVRTPGADRAAREQLKTFGYVGTAALGVVAVAVVIVGLAANRRGTAELLAMVGLFAFVGYLVLAYLVARLVQRR